MTTRRLAGACVALIAAFTSAAPHDDPPSPTARDAAVFVRHADGGPAAGALVKVHSWDSWYRRGRTDADGRFVCRDVTTERGAIVTVSGAVVDEHREEFDALDEPPIVTLPGALVTGEVRFAGPARDEPLEFVLVPGEAASFWRRNVIPDELGTAVTVVDGRFAISGAEPGEPYRLVLPHDWCTPGHRRVLEVVPPADLVVHLEPLPQVRTRVVGPDGTRIRDADVELRWWGERPGWSLSYTFEREDGVYEWWSPTVGPTFDAVIEGRARGLRGRMALSDIAATRSIEAGPLVLQAGPMIALTVVDDAGEPVAGAVARLRDGDARRRRAARHEPPEFGVSEPTDAGGVTRVGPVIPSDAWIDVVSLGHATVSVPVPDMPTDALTVVVERASSLLITLDDDAPVDLLDVRVEASGAVFADRAGLALRPSLGAAQAGFERVGERAVCVLEGQREFLLNDVVPDQPLDVSVTLDRDDVVWGPRQVVVPRGERVVLPTSPKFGSAPSGWTLRGRIVDELGEPLADGGVRVIDPPDVADEHVGRDGDVLLRGLRGDRAVVEVWAPGFVPHTFEVERASGLAVFALVRGRDVDVHVVDEHGEPVDEATVFCTASRSTSPMRFLEPRSPCRLSGLPNGIVRVFVAMKGRDPIVVEHDTAESRLEVVVERGATLTVTWDEGAWGHEGLRIDAVDPETSRRAWSHLISTGERAARRAVVEAVGPGRYALNLGFLARITSVEDMITPSADLTEPIVVDVGTDDVEVHLTPKKDD